MNVRESIDKINAGRRAANQRIDVGLDPAAAVRELTPTLSSIAVESAVRLAGLASFDFAALSIVLAGLAEDSLLETAEIPEPPARPYRPTPDEVAAEWLLRDLSAPSSSATEAPTPEGDQP
jgi:hypothetical protein